MHPHSYFEKLAQEFEGHPYEDRFLEELEDHLQDYCKEEKIEQNSLSPRDLNAYFGEAAEVKKVFISIVDPWRNLFFVCEALLLSTFSAVIGNMYFNTLSKLFLDFSGAQYITWISLILIPFLWLMVMEMAYALFSQIKPLTNKKLWEWNMLVHSLPLIMMVGLVFFELPLRYPISSFLLQITIFLTLITSNIIVSWIAWKITLKRERVFSRSVWDALIFVPITLLVGVFIFSDVLINYPLTTLLIIVGMSTGFIYLGKKWSINQKIKYVPLWLSKGFYIAFITLIILRSIITHLEPVIFERLSSLMLILSPVFLFDLLNGMIWNNSGNSPFWSIYFPLLIFLFVGIESLWMVIRRKKFLSDRGIVFMYTLSLIFLSPNAFTKSPEFTQPTLWISKTIEEEKVGPLYANLKYVNLDKTAVLNSKLDIQSGQNTFFKYNIEHVMLNKEEYFLIQNNFQENFWIHLKDLEENFSIGNFSALFKEDIPTDIPVKSIDLGSVNKPEGNPLSEKILQSYLKNKQDFTVQDIAISLDQTWILVVLSEGKNEMQEVYLIQSA